MNKEPKPLSELLPDRQKQTTEPLEMILTETEKQQALNHAIRQKQESVIRRMEVYAGQDQIDKVLAETNWMERIEPETVLFWANQRKHWQMDKERAKAAEIKKKEALRAEEIKSWTAEKFRETIKNHMISKHGRFEYGEDNKKYVDAVCYFLSADPRFGTVSSFDFRKGLLIQGNAGTGKTETIRAVSRNPVFPITIISMLEIQEQLKRTGECLINTNRMILLDDVGTEEPIIKYYGTDICWFKDFIELYYHNHQNYAGLLITTNLTWDEIEHRYGYRVRSRMREMFNNIVLTGKDLRK